MREYDVSWEYLMKSVQLEMGRYALLLFPIWDCACLNGKAA